MGNGHSRNAAKKKSLIKLVNIISPAPSDLAVAQVRVGTHSTPRWQIAWVSSASVCSHTPYYSTARTTIVAHSRVYDIVTWTTLAVIDWLPNADVKSVVTQQPYFQAATVVPIKTIAAACGLDESDYEPYGHYKAKVRARHGYSSPSYRLSRSRACSARVFWVLGFHFCQK
jgi:hypothetical protein